MQVNIDTIVAAKKRIGDRARRTPLLSSPSLDEIAGRRVLVKAECLQHTGSFKIRGAWSAVSALDQEARARGVIAFSSGNHAQGVAFAAREHTTSAVIVMPSDAPKLKIKNTKRLGAEVVFYDRDTQDRDAICAALAHERGLTMILPYDNAMVIAGQGTVGLEIAAQASAAGVGRADVLVPCGGGGLSAGIAIALAEKSPDLQVRTVEPVDFDDTARSLSSGQIQTNRRLAGSICDAITTPSPGKKTFPVLRALCGAPMVVPDEDCQRAMAAAFARLKIVCEPGGAIALAAALFQPKQFAGDTVIAVVSGGNVDGQQFRTALEKFAD